MTDPSTSSTNRSNHTALGIDSVEGSLGKIPLLPKMFTNTSQSKPPTNPTPRNRPNRYGTARTKFSIWSELIYHCRGERTPL
jgi:hypothetical protein